MVMQPLYLALQIHSDVCSFLISCWKPLSQTELSDSTVHFALKWLVIFKFHHSFDTFSSCRHDSSSAVHCLWGQQGVVFLMGFILVYKLMCCISKELCFDLLLLHGSACSLALWGQYNSFWASLSFTGCSCVYLDIRNAWWHLQDPHSHWCS